MTRPPKDPSPVASTGGVANSQGQAIFTGDWNALINDYVESPNSTTLAIEQRGQSTVTINANQTRGTANITLSPALADSILTNYLVLPNVRSATLATQVMRTIRATLTSTTIMALEAWRNFNTAVLTTNVSGVTVAGNALTNVSGMAVANPEPGTVSDAHGNSGTFFDHAHDTVGHPVTEPNSGQGHTHTVSSLSSNLGQDIFTIDWIIVHV